MKTLITEAKLINAGAEIVAVMDKTSKDKTAFEIISQESATRPGFFFVVGNDFPDVVARFFIGNQRNNKGFAEKISRWKGNIQSCRSLTDMNMWNLVYKKGVKIYFLPYKNTKYLTYPEKGQISMMFSGPHKSELQTMSEINRILNDLYKFAFQKY